MSSNESMIFFHSSAHVDVQLFNTAVFYIALYCPGIL